MVGSLFLEHRVVLAPLTRCRASATYVPLLPTVAEYYSQRASIPGTLLIAEATNIAEKAGGHPNAPGIWSDEQVAAWKEITDAVHAKGSFIYLQLRALGRGAVPEVLASQDPPFPYVSASAVQLTGKSRAPRPLTIPEIEEYVQLYATAASNAVHRAGFDGVEIQVANGFLLDQFIQDVTNKRTDKYGGSIENRARFGLEVLEAVVQAVGAEKSAIRLSPWSDYNDMLMIDPKPTFSHFVTCISDLFPNLSYLHLVEPRVNGNFTRDPSSIGPHESNDFIRDIWGSRPLISAGGYERESALDAANTKGDLIAFGRHFLANPDLPLRLKEDVPLNKYDRATFYIAGDTSGKGFTDYPFVEPSLAGARPPGVTVTSTSPKLFQPTKVGNLALEHRIVLAPLTRCRASATYVPLLPTVAEYYSQRATIPGTLLIAEATNIAEKAGGHPNAPGIWNDEQVAAWREITNAVHAKGSYIYLQLRALGRGAVPEVLASQNPPLPYVSASAVQLTGKSRAPRPLTVLEIQEYVQLYAKAASNAVHRAGFDGVEIQVANGFLPDQFLQDVTNKRTDKYGGSIENRARFGLEILEAVVRAVGAERAAIRLSPWSDYNDMLMSDPKPTFSHFVTRIRDSFPDLSYLHLVEPRVNGNFTRDPSSIGAHESNDFIRDIWRPRPLISAGGYERESALDAASTKGDLIAFGRHFLANPDLPLRLREDIPLNKYDRETFYTGGDTSGKGFTDYPFAEHRYRQIRPSGAIVTSFSPKLFQPTKVGNLLLKHRIVLAPLTRCRASATYVPLLPTVARYYSQRANMPGTLLIAEATNIAEKAGGHPNAPGIWSDEQVAAWKQITNAVHAKGSYIYLQLRALGRGAVPEVLASQKPPLPYVSASAVQLTGKSQAPRPLTIPEIEEYVQLYATAASNAIHRAGFDGVEIQVANGFLPDQFLQDVTNKRTDKYGGSIENRARFGLEILEAVVKAVGAERSAIRLSPWSDYNDMLMTDPKPTFHHFVTRIRDLFPNLSYLHVVEPRVTGNFTRDPSSIGSHESNEFIRDIWGSRPLISAGGYERESAIEAANTKGDLIAFGRHFLANPDLPLRVRKGIPFNRYDRATFYVAGDTSGKGFTDYPYAKLRHAHPGTRPSV